MFTLVPHLIIACHIVFKNALSNQSCPSLATDESTHRIKDHSLVGHVLLNTTASTKGLCFFKCTRKCRCTSFNYQPNGHNTCELNDEDDSTHPEGLQSRPGVNYYKVHLVRNIGVSIITIVRIRSVFLPRKEDKSILRRLTILLDKAVFFLNQC